MSLLSSQCDKPLDIAVALPKASSLSNGVRSGLGLFCERELDSPPCVVVTMHSYMPTQALTSTGRGHMLQVLFSPSLGRRRQWMPIKHCHLTTSGKACDVHTMNHVCRIDCATVALGRGRFLVAGGCPDHPQKCHVFLRSAFIFDAVAHTVRPLPDMRQGE